MKEMSVAIVRTGLQISFNSTEKLDDCPGAWYLDNIDYPPGVF